ncbi:MAG: hypothetical protein QXU98_10195, partial [Candidatus Parvarchaeota archaeon]
PADTRLTLLESGLDNAPNYLFTASPLPEDIVSIQYFEYIPSLYAPQPNGNGYYGQCPFYTTDNVYVKSFTPSTNYEPMDEASAPIGISAIPPMINGETPASWAMIITFKDGSKMAIGPLTQPSDISTAQYVYPVTLPSCSWTSTSLLVPSIPTWLYNGTSYVPSSTNTTTTQPSSTTTTTTQPSSTTTTTTQPSSTTTTTQSSSTKSTTTTQLSTTPISTTPISTSAISTPTTTPNYMYLIGFVIVFAIVILIISNR